MGLGAFRSEGGRGRYVRAYERAMGELPPATSQRDVPTEFGTVRVYEWSAAGAASPPVLLLPGRSSGVPMWGENLPDLVPHRRVIAVDALGDAGMSVQSKPLRSFTDQAVWVDQVLEALGVGRVHSLGHSFGGATAAVHALHFPERLASLALLEPAFVLAWPPPATFFWAMVASLPTPHSWRDRALAALGGVDVSEVRVRTPISEMITSATAEFRAALPTPKPLGTKELAALTMPAYVAIAERKSVAGGSRAARRARHISGVRVETWPGTTHSLPMQVREPLAERLAAFWRDADHGDGAAP
ncbi:alpha/beta fold hydrolase [Actinomadura sp. GC306]|uniref:alpha/beta fold hydrolase n=1 Tax=Actinomadura sp. GC306 TaxID=2530367 RepID=UPI00104D73CB|nr:alpha/beta fold hydrolase [Actinomadura sp. GC306]TDC66866.1 alpha/beta fold hydrolase [Actinomadura sp. GC306]